ncbi:MULTISPECIES: OmpA family protein [unclassified Aureispira]|uniref:OmpA family protein n=1 Tax=unclassified Aureispira TaxID=2649989 RepID=UPI000698FB73|nr:MULTISPECIES: OmpA family protein [unclassified Aureispira]WMX13550.1 OmpA family protein [Aureispira sp. CCB-E]
MNKIQSLLVTLVPISLLLIGTTTYAQVLQNMVKNPSFEQYRKVPTDLGEWGMVDYWSSPTEASPDYFHKRAAGKNVDVPYNKMGRCMARSGYAYTGIYAYASRYLKRNFREYVQLELKQPLLAGNTYCVKAHVFLAQSSNRAVGALGMTASKIRINQKDELPIVTKNMTYMLQEDRSPLDERAWVEITCQYKAQGGERYLVLGNFDDDKKTKVTGAIENDTFKNPHVDFAYYYIDDVCVTNSSTNFSCDCGSFDLIRTRGEERIVLDVKVQQKQYYLGQVVIMQNLDFERGKITMLSGSQGALDDLVGTLRLNPNYHVEISGHTDDKGDPQKNQILSKKRAEVVYNYLLSSGIRKERLTYRGYGQSRPIALNKTIEGRQKNERIQFRITKK